MNLSSSTLGKKHIESGILSGSSVVVFLFVLLLALWGSMQWYLKTLDEQRAEKQAALEVNASQLNGDSVDRVASLDARLTLIKKQINENTVDMTKLLNQLENVVLPSVRLTKYEFNQKDKSVLVDGETDNFKYVAQQIISFKSEALFAGIKVQAITRTLEGRIAFSLKAEFN